jgi:hypothetical protein
MHIGAKCQLRHTIRGAKPALPANTNIASPPHPLAPLTPKDGTIEVRMSVIEKQVDPVSPGRRVGVFRIGDIVPVHLINLHS